jgi:rod shape-determining protein MreC
MWSLIERAKKIIFALVLSIIPLVLLYVQSKDEEIRNIFVWPIMEVSGVIEKGALAVSGFVSDALYRYVYLVGRADELVTLRAEVMETKALKGRLEELMNDGAALAELQLRVDDVGLSKNILARIIARAGAPMARMIRLDKGSIDGVKAKSPVVAQSGVVGQVLSVAPHFCDVLLVTDASFAIDAKIIGSNARGLLRGVTRSSEYMMEIRDIDGLVAIGTGDIVVTSGVNSNFPHGIPIGIVVSSSRSKDGLYVSARIEPFVHMDSLFRVAILDVDNTVGEIDSLTAAWPLAVQ